MNSKGGVHERSLVDYCYLFVPTEEAVAVGQSITGGSDITAESCDSSYSGTALAIAIGITFGATAVLVALFVILVVCLIHTCQKRKKSAKLPPTNGVHLYELPQKI